MNTSRSITGLFNQILKKRTPVYFVSPHLDDAVLSAGGAISYLSEHVSTNVINVFTNVDESGKPSLSIISFLRQCGYKSAGDLLKARIKEDVAVLGDSVNSVTNLGFVDSLWRKIGSPSPLRQLIGSLLPEALHVYPTFKFHVAKGKISRHDGQLILSIKNSLSKAVPKNAIVFAPLAVGNHVDHVLVHTICKELFGKRVIFWLDYPYSMRFKENKKYIESLGLVSAQFHDNQSEKRKYIMGYKSQVKGLFPNGIPTLIPDTFWIYE